MERELVLKFRLLFMSFNYVLLSLRTGLKVGIDERMRVASRLLYTALGVLFHSFLGVILVFECFSTE